MMSFRLILIFPLFFILSGIVFADIKIFLFHRIESTEDNIALRNVAHVFGNSVSLDEIRGITISEELYSDGYIDRRELGELLRKKTNDSVYIIGNAVRIVRTDLDLELRAEDTCAGGVLVRKGEVVNLIVRKKGISIRLIGKAMEDRREGEEINVKMRSSRGRGSKIVKGRVKGCGEVEKIL